jgi:hypothetical protein
MLYAVAGVVPPVSGIRVTRLTHPVRVNVVLLTAFVTAPPSVESQSNVISRKPCSMYASSSLVIVQVAAVGICISFV